MVNSMNFRGSVEFKEDLPQEANNGDVYVVKYAVEPITSKIIETNNSFVYNDEEWVIIEELTEENLTIDEAIEIERKLAVQCKEDKIASIGSQDLYHIQLANWLEELKNYREKLQ